nr:UDP-N-acetylmuramoyl-L-alanine--D-glutamate ligase [Thermopetrobacter sp. TC1]
MTFAARTYAGRRLAVFGLGRSGIACAQALMAGGAEVLAWDDGTAGRERAREAGVPLVDLKTVDFSGLDALVLAPGVPLTHPVPHWTVRKAEEAGVPVIGDTEIFHAEVRARGGRIVAVTGTNGKSTTTALIGHVLSLFKLDAHVGGNIGRAVFSLPEPRPGRTYVIEMSSFQIDLSPTFRPDVGVLLNVTPDHLDRHGSLENYAAVKARLFARQREGDVAVISVDDAFCREALARVPEGVRRMPFSIERLLDEGVCAINGVLQERQHGKTVRGMDLSTARALRGRHNWQNAAAAWAACRALKLDAAMIARGFVTFPGLAHRMEEVGLVEGVRFINDSKATNADAAARSLSTFSGIHWIAGGRAKAGGIEPLVALAKENVRHAWLIGEAAADFAETLKRAHVPFDVVETMERAVERAFAAAQREAAGGENPVVLLAPACASFDQYPSFEARGEHFRALVEALKERTGATGKQDAARAAATQTDNMT